MSNQLFKPSCHLIHEWPEVFDDLYMNTLPVAYLEKINLEFSDGRVWEIDITAKLTKQLPNSIADILLNVLQEYKDDIQKIEFKVDIGKLRTEMTKIVSTIL
jgi:hypothetical protein